jgi:hypothetical protein
MKKIFFLLLITLAVISCSKKSDSTSNEFSNKLTLGTGFTSNYMDLVGVGTSFTASTAIYFRLESAVDIGGSNVRIKIDKQDGTAFNSFDYVNPQSYGHILLSSFVINTPGSYKATGILVTGLKTVASINFTVN